MIFPLDGPGAYGAITVTSSAQEVKVGVSVLSERKVITIQPTDGVVYYGYDSSVTSSNGTKVLKGQWIQLEAGESLPVWVVAESGDSVNTRITEVS